ncbi:MULTISPECIES: AMP-binding protein [unclassified Cryobacterium]|uniref:class I adenylate-forming enzyme family protein n=1 Tax=unclassified Cryobacterium TaxID=2649013 RepID=UPI000CE32C60|nr:MULTISPECIES: AMP-binding protein [unclassified Cryobacterium]TFB57072.1 long-chain fatty acid--CoA ligase [Cryobacterium sp. Sr3]TFC70240.1 long-chain fatty acid--CoA ligase [Cryobacterium sp. TMT2-4]
MPFLDRLQHWAQVQPDATAVAVGADRISFAELRDAAAAILPATPRISSVCLPHGTAFAVAFAAGVAEGRCSAILNPDWPEAQRRVVESRLARTAGLDGRVAAGAPLLGTELRDGPPDRDFLYGFTSGTTSVPKAFTRSRASWQRSFALGTEFFGLTRHDRTLAPGPLSASLSLYAFAESLHTGSAFFALHRFSAAAAVACVTVEQITRIVAAPTVLRVIAAHALSVGTDGRPPTGRGLTGIVSAGAKLDPGTLSMLRLWAPDASVFEYYGAAELSFVTASVLRPGEVSPISATAVGRALPGVEVRIQDDAGRALPTGTPGTIFVRSLLVGGGYAWGDDGEAFRREVDWCTVGDIGFLDPAAVLHHLGRRADLIVTSGHNVYPQQVEAALRGLPGVEAAVVTGLPDPVRGTRVVAAVIAGSETDAARIRSYVAALLAAPHRPRAYYALAELPLTSAGKLSRVMLRRWIEEGDRRVRPLR